MPGRIAAAAALAVAPICALYYSDALVSSLSLSPVLNSHCCTIALYDPGSQKGHVQKLGIEGIISKAMIRGAVEVTGEVQFEVLSFNVLNSTWRS